MSRERAFTIGALVYAVAAIITFGHAAQTASMRHPDWSADVIIGSGVIGAAFWPLYWSWEAWS